MLELVGITSAYGEARVIENLSLTVSVGTQVSVLGSNGVGKSTLLKTIMGLLPLRGGSIRWMGTDISKLSSWERVEKGIGYVPQGLGSEGFIEEVLPQADRFDGRVLASDIHANVWKVLVDIGQKVVKDEILVVLEAMKMEIVVKAPVDGTITSIHCRAGKQVLSGAPLVVVKDEN